MSNNNDWDYLVSVLPDNFNDKKIEYSEAVNWSHSNLSHKNVLKLTLEDVYLLDKKVLDIINTENNSMIGPFEDDWIHSREVQQNILNKLRIYISSCQIDREIFILNEMIRLFEVAIKSNHFIYFLF